MVEVRKIILPWLVLSFIDVHDVMVKKNVSFEQGGGGGGGGLFSFYSYEFCVGFACLKSFV